jgi:prolyl 4-hydroxylase
MQDINQYNIMKVENEKLVELYLVEKFLSDEECDKIINDSIHLLHPSTITHPTPDKDFRTSYTADLRETETPFIIDINKRICNFLSIGYRFGEPTQLQHYAVGQQFKDHTDFFEPYSDDYYKFGKKAGNRTWTFMIYLNHVQEGGGTHFVKLDKMVKPTKGLAVVWNNQYKDGKFNYDTLHAGLPVIRGEKYIITKWFREKIWS